MMQMRRMTMVPSQMSSTELSQKPSSSQAKSQVPSAELSHEPSPTQAPSSPMPTSVCLLDLDVRCNITTGTYTGENCSTPAPVNVQSSARPTAATIRYNGGGCEQSENRQFLNFTCVDTEQGPISAT